MHHFRHADLEGVVLPGRVIQKALGKDGLSKSEKMTVGFGRYSAESGPIESRSHAKEVVCIIDAKDGWVRYGPARGELGGRLPLEAGMVLHNPLLALISRSDY